jgi:uncharacterized protein involved in outer membrane biogenesis
MKVSRRKAAGIGLIALGLVAASFFVSVNILVDRNADRLIQEIQKSLGRKLTFDQLQPDFWGSPGLSVTQLRVAEDQRFAATPFIQTKRLKLQLAWLPLLLGRVEVKRMILDEPEIQIIRNEAGSLNLLALAAPKESPREAKEKKAQTPSELFVSAVRVANGKIHYVDRSVKEPVEVVIRNVDLDVRGLILSGKAEVKLAATLFFDSQRQNISLEGKIGPFQGGNEWTQQPVDLKVRADPLHLPQLARALPALRDKAEFYLGITGPFALKARLLGTIKRPRITDLNLTGSVFDSTRKNASVSGEWDFSRGGTWTDGVIKGKITVDPVGLEQLRKLPAVKHALPSALVTTGLVGVTADLQGPFDDLKVHAVIKATESAIQYGQWFKKAKGIPVAVELKAERQKDRFLFEPSTLTLHNTKLTFSGLLENSPAQINLKLRSDGTHVSGWDRLLPFVSSYNPAGNLRLDLSVKGNLNPGDRGIDIHGSVDLADVQLKDKTNGRSVEKIAASLSFRGKEARTDNGTVRLGSSDVAFEAVIRDLSEPVIRYTLRSPKLNLADLTGSPAYKTDEMKSLLSTGELDAGKEKTTLRGNITSAEGILQDLPYRNLRGEIAWSSGNWSFKNLSLQVLSGTLRGAGNWDTGPNNSQRMALATRIESVDLKSLLTQKFPKFKDNIEGWLNLNAKLRGASTNGATIGDNLQGEGDTQVRDGTLKDFNLIQLVLSKISAVPGMSNLVSSRTSPRYSSMLQSRDTPFDTLAATFTVEQGRIRSKDFYMAAPDYSIYGEGSVGFDKSIRWNATLTMSTQFSQELMQEQKNVRYLLDRQGRLAIPFRLEGTLPRVQAKPDIPKLAEAIQRGFLKRGRERSPGGKPLKESE